MALSEMPSSRAIWAIGLPEVWTNRTASSLNSFVYVFWIFPTAFPLSDLLPVYLRFGGSIKSGEGQGEWQRTPRPPGNSLLDPYRASILTLWEQGCRNGQHILRTIRTQGYEGSDTLLRAYITQLRKQLPVQAPSGGQAPSSVQTTAKTPREIRWLLTKHREDLDECELAELDRLLQTNEEVGVLRSLLHTFLNMVRQRKHEQLRSWMETAVKSDIAEIKSFVAGIERDYDAVKEALRLPWSQGITEGKVNKLKTLKRVMYGKAGFPLLRQRLLHDA